MAAGVLFKGKEIAAAGVEAKIPVRYYASSGGAGEREHRDAEMMESTHFLWVFPLESFTLNFFVLHSSVPSITLPFCTSRQQ